MILTKTVKIKLNISTKDIMPTIKQYTKAYNLVCKTGWEDDDCNGISLHHKTYRSCREFLPSQLAISSRVKAAESLKSVRARKRKNKKVSCPVSLQCSIRYDSNSHNVWFDKGIISISTVSGRKKINFYKNPCLAQFKDWRRKSAELFVRKNKVFLAIVFELETENIKPSNKIVGIDRGIKKIAVTSDSQFFGGNHVKKVVQRYRVLRKNLQSRGTQSSKRHLQRLSLKENRFRKDENHCVSKKIVSSILPGTVLVLENLKNIRENSKKFRREQRFWINNWSFFQLENFLRYKAEDKRCLVEYVDARYTSQKCSSCKKVDKKSRKSQHVFKCIHCGFSLHADLNAARNISNNYKDAKCYPCRAPVNEPIVAANPVGQLQARSFMGG